MSCNVIAEAITVMHYRVYNDSVGCSLEQLTCILYVKVHTEYFWVALLLKVKGDLLFLTGSGWGQTPSVLDTEVGWGEGSQEL